MVEYVEKCILRAGHILQILYIIDNQGIYALVEMEKAVYVLGCRGGILALEESGCNIENARMRIALFHAYAYGLDKVRLANTRRTENEQGVKGLQRRIVGDGHTYRTGNLVAVAGAIVLKRILRIQLRVEVESIRLPERICRLSLALRQDCGRRTRTFL